MNKKNTIIAGILAGGLFLSTSSADVTMASDNSNKTSEEKTSVTYKFEYPVKYSYQLNGIYQNLLKKIALNKESLLVAIEQGFKKPVIVDKEEVEKPEQKPSQDKEEVVKPEQKPSQDKEEVVKPEQKPSQDKEEVVKPEQKPSQDKEEVVKPEQKPSQDKEEIKVSAEIQQVVNLTNQERTKAGLKPLQIDTKLTQSAQAKSQDMKNKNYFSHTSPTYGSPFDQMKAFGVTYKSAAENIAQGQRNTSEVVKAWMESAGHRANIMNPSYTHIGVGLSDSGYYWTQQFISK